MSADLLNVLAGPTRFPLGRTLITAGMNDAIADDEVLAMLVIDGIRRHGQGDWGDVDTNDRAANERALRIDARLVSEYELPASIRDRYRDDRVFIITEADRACTTVLWPSEY